MNNLQLTNYELKGVLGQGGMSVVYLGEHRNLQIKVAVKVLNRMYVNNENIRKRFIMEAQNMFRMKHINIVGVTDMIEEGETVAFVMEYVEGWSLKEYLERKGILREEEISQILVQLLAALDYVHSQGLVHRDIRPSNILLTPGGVVKLMDFGISKRTEGAMEYTATGLQQILGTPMYMSPEQIKSTKDVTYVSDLYSLGVVLWEMVTGRKPYNGEAESTYQIQTRIVREDLPMTGTRWDVIIGGSTVKDEGGRYRSAKEFRAAVERLIHGEPPRPDDRTVVEEGKGDEKLRPEVKRGKTASVSQIIAALMLLGVLIGGYVIWSWEEKSVTYNVFKSTVSIGSQVWQTKNLNVDRFRNGDLIPQAQSIEAWEEAGDNQQPAWCYYDNDPENGKIYGKLYNWYAVNDPRGLAPQGWHIPSDTEWTKLTNDLGGEEMAGGKMKSKGTTYWESPNVGATNESGFIGLPGGYRLSNGEFNYLGSVGVWWSSSEDNDNLAWNLYLYLNIGDVDRFYDNKGDGLSVRCLRD